MGYDGYDLYAYYILLDMASKRAGERAMRLYKDVKRVQVIHLFETHFYFLWWATICVLGGILYVAVQHL